MINPKYQIHSSSFDNHVCDYYHRVMEYGKSKIQVEDVQTGQCLFECSIENAEAAYNFAAQMEQLGLDIKVSIPTLTETLTNSLGLSPVETEKYLQSVDEEMQHHDGSCCFEDS